MQKLKAASKIPVLFLYKIVSNLAYRSPSQQQPPVGATCRRVRTGRSTDPTPSIEHQLYTQEQIARLRLAVSELPPRCREVFIMHKFKHHPYSVIMSELGISESTILKHIVKAMEHCRRRMRELDAPVDQNIAE